MVVFTCQHCNASLKRVAVAKHYSKACRNTPHLTCIDCLKDFHGVDYNSHMTCVTEDERYGDKNFVAKKTGVKQTEWIDVVHLCAKKNENVKFKFIFYKLASYQNVPRKKAKFLNFIKSSLPKFSPDIAVEVFQIIDEEFVKQKKKDSQNENNDSKIVKNTDEQISDAKENTGKSGEKKKNKKRNRSIEREAPPAEDTDINVPTEKKSKKKKLNNMKLQELEFAGDMATLFNIKVKNKKDTNKNGFLNQTSESVDEQENHLAGNQNGIESHEEPHETDNHAKLSKKELKKLKKKQKYDAELKNIEESESTKDEVFINEENDQDSSKPIKKQKKRKATVNESENGGGKKQKIEGNEESENCFVENEINVEEEKPQQGKVRFNWEEIIKEVLRKNPDHEMSLKKISKKVLAEYQSVKGDRETYEELISKFNKKINKTIGVRVLKDKAKLLPED
ncbi:unnamed protein product [Nezara viridula]|uniref:Cell growth-regulating nucleolar protein n=1 Tax=Nezara viridula TaxID=85310 RepID=A0A9P0MHZ4_NEZVI|nr:unnamed protein product [Nezara viridula]